MSSPSRQRLTSREQVTHRVSGFRRALDITASVVGLLLLSPVLAVLALLVRLTSPGPVLFRQVRLTHDHQPFTIYKFRSMRVSDGGPEVTAPGDCRVTPLGSFLRKTSLDELPQLFNVLRGEMTLVGPRPETPALGAKYPEELLWVLDETPGLTGPTQITMRDNHVLLDGLADPEDWYLHRLVPSRVAMDLTYLCNPSPLATLRILLLTVRYLATGRSPGAPTRG
jgi:lipopolysaccharide/colanic/teichoic acid biosynthesis glycosyltransferase